MFVLVPLLLSATGPLPAEQVATLAATPEDVLDKEICDGELRVTAECRDAITYVKSNEHSHHLFREWITNLGGGYVGVGADQGLTFVAWARSDVAWLIDYDPEIVRLNEVHRALILAASDRERFRDLWLDEHEADAIAAIDAAYPERADRTALRRVYLRRRRAVRKHLRESAEEGLRVARHWLDEEDSYQYVRQLFQWQRVRILAADLLKRRALTGIAAAAEKLRVPIRVLYLSNAEQFWSYSRSFREIMRALPMDEHSRVLRTIARKVYGPRPDGRFVYVIEAGLDFQERLADPRTRSVGALMKHRVAGPPGVFTIGLARDPSGGEHVDSPTP